MSHTIRDFHILVECLLYIDDDFENEVTCHVWVSRSLDLTHFFNLLIMYREIVYYSISIFNLGFQWCGFSSSRISIFYLSHNINLFHFLIISHFIFYSIRNMFCFDLALCHPCYITFQTIITSDNPTYRDLSNLKPTRCYHILVIINTCKYRLVR